MTEKIKMRSFWDIWLLIDLVCFGSVCVCVCVHVKQAPELQRFHYVQRSYSRKWENERKALQILFCDHHSYCYVMLYVMIRLVVMLMSNLMT